MAAIASDRTLPAGRRVRQPVVWVLLGLALVSSNVRLSDVACYVPTRSASTGSKPAVNSAAATTNRRAILGGLGAAGLAPVAPAHALETFRNDDLRYSLKHPGGLQESKNPAYNFFLRDIIEPLDSIAVQVIESKRKSLDEIGTPQEVAEKLLADLIPPKAPREIIKAESIEVDGQRRDIIEYRFQWKFDKAAAELIGRTRYQLHCRALVALGRRKQFVVLEQLEEPRWVKNEGNYYQALKTFELF